MRPSMDPERPWLLAPSPGASRGAPRDRGRDPGLEQESGAAFASETVELERRGRARSARRVRSAVAGMAVAGMVAASLFLPATGAPAPEAAAPSTAAPSPAAPSPAAPSPAAKASEEGVVDETDLAALKGRAGDLLRRGKSAESASLYARILAADPEDGASMSGRVRALAANGLWRQALEEARRFAAAHPASAEVRGALGEALYRAGSLAEAREVLERLASEAAPPARGLLHLGLVRVAEGRDEEAADLLARAVALAPEDRDALFWAAGAAASRAGAIELLERYLKLSEGDDPDRIEGARGTIRLDRALGERRVWIPEARPERLEVPLRSLRDREGRATGFVVELTAGPEPGEEKDEPRKGARSRSRTIRVLLDSGSTGLFLVQRIALGAGFAALADETTFAGGGEGRQATKRGLIPFLSLGGVRFKDALVSTTTQEIEPTGRYHGLLGLSVFEGYRITLDLARERMILEAAPRGRGGTGAGGEQAITAGTGDAGAGGEESLGAGRAPERSDPNRPEGAFYWSVSSQMLVEAGTSDGRAGLFLFDTGATRSLLSLDIAEQGRTPHVGGETTVRAFGGPLREARTVHGVRVRFQGLETSDPALSAADLGQRSRLGGVEIAGFLGLDLLDRSRITVDTLSRRVLVSRDTRK